MLLLGFLLSLELYYLPKEFLYEAISEMPLPIASLGIFSP